MEGDFNPRGLVKLVASGQVSGQYYASCPLTMAGWRT